MWAVWVGLSCSDDALHHMQRRVVTRCWPMLPGIGEASIVTTSVQHTSREWSDVLEWDGDAYLSPAQLSDFGRKGDALTRLKRRLPAGKGFELLYSYF